MIATGAWRLSRSAMASKATLPEQKIRRRTAAGSVIDGSSSTSWNEPWVRSSIGERVSFIRSGRLGVNCTSGLRTSRRIWRRSRWKYCAAVVALQTWMLSSAARVRKRSMRALECSGPWPSKPWGSSRTRPEVWPHLSSAATRYWSMMIWAPLTKSPNWASHSTSASLLATE